MRTLALTTRWTDNAEPTARLGTTRAKGRANGRVVSVEPRGLLNVGSHRRPESDQTADRREPAPRRDPARDDRGRGPVVRRGARSRLGGCLGAGRGPRE